jgi:hypothetical protein
MNNVLRTVLGLVAAVGAAIILAGCQSTAVQTPATVAAQVCPVVTATVAALSADPSLSAVAKADVAKVAPIASQVCSAAASVTTSSLEQLAAVGFPLLISIEQAKGDAAAVNGLVAAQIIFTAAMAQVESTAAPSAPTVPASPAQTSGLFPGAPGTWTYCGSNPDGCHGCGDGFRDANGECLGTSQVGI